MGQENENKTAPETCSEYLANERTFLAWIRTSIGIMAFGFVVEKFALFMKQITYVLGKQGFPVKGMLFGPEEFPRSSIFGIFLVGLGALMGVLAFVKYKKSEKLIEQGKYHATFLLEFMLTLSMLAVGVLLIIYLIYSI